jgi:virginiamycin B lyase
MEINVHYDCDNAINLCDEFATLPARTLLVRSSAIQMKINRLLYSFAFTAIGAANADGPDLKAVQHPMSELHAIAKFSIPGSPDWVAIGDSVWISNNPKNNISELDAKTNQVGAVIAVPKKPCSGLAIAFGSVWVPVCSDGTVQRVDPKSQKIVAVIPSGVANDEGGITVGEGSIWMPSDTAGVLSRIDPATNKVASKISIPDGSYTAAFDAGSVWITSTKNNLLTRVDAKTEKVIAKIPVGPAPRFLATGLGGVWTLNQGDGSVSRVDPATNTVSATIEVGVPGPGGDIAVGEGAVWVTANGKPLSKIDPATNRVVAQYVGKGGDALRVGLGSLWLSNHEFHEVWRIDPKGL